MQDYGFSYSFATKILRNKDVRVNGKATKDNLEVSIGDNVTFFYSEDMLEKRYDVLFEDEDDSEQYGDQVNIGVITTPLSEIAALEGSYDVRIELAEQ